MCGNVQFFANFSPGQPAFAQVPCLGVASFGISDGRDLV